nr:MAG TPA: Portal protein, Proximal tail tube, phi29, mature virion, VIRUS.3A [Caudoviricetes sp.]
MRATLSILGLYQREPTLFDELELPGSMNKDVLIDNILYEAAPLEAYYPDPNFMKFMIGRWSFMNQSVWQKLYDTTVLEYNPIFNYDRTEEWSENEQMLDKRTLAGTERETSTDNSSGEIRSSGTVKSELNVSGYNESSYVPREQTIETPDTLTSNTSETDRIVSIDKNDTENMDRKRDNIRTGRAFGNIGVTTTQQMIQQERETALFNMYKVITDSFIERFCLMIYT